jgi:type IV pilus assembly protein PilW
MNMRNNHKGFTLIELLVAMTVGLVVMAGVSATFRSQQKSYLLQEQMAAMQQNLRAAMYHMEREIRMAGCDPNQTVDAQFVTANATSITFTQDLRGDTEGSKPDGDTDDPNENITYNLNGGELRRDDPNGIGDQVIADNISALNFVYLNQAGTRIDDDSAGNVTTSILQIRSVEITLLARTGRGDRGFQNNTTYKNRPGDNIFVATGDNFRRKLLTTCITCRNLGL